jgi:glycosyltransferase involved in cell wall biosynthesis
MKILHIITGLSNGGAEAVLYRLTTNDHKNTHEVISLMDEGVYGELLTRAGIRVYALHMPRGRLSIKGVIYLYQLVRSIKYDVIQTWMYHADLIGGLVARIAGAKIVVWGIRGPFDRKKTSFFSTVIIYLCAFFSRWVPIAIISNSEHASEVHRKVGYAPNKLVNIPNGYLFNQFRPDESAKSKLLLELNLNPDIVLIGMVARFDPYKDHETLFEALSILARNGRLVTCLLVGTGMSMTSQPLAYLIKKNSVQHLVKLLGPRFDIPKIMAALDVHVLSSSAESFPNVLAEAMACGTPCVTTNVGDAALIVGNTGWVVPHSDASALAGAIQAALEEMKDSSKWEVRKGACRNCVVESYSLDKMIESYFKLWVKVVSNK